MTDGRGRGEHSKRREKGGQRQRKDEAWWEILRSTDRLEGWSAGYLEEIEEKQS